MLTINQFKTKKFIIRREIEDASNIPEENLRQIGEKSETILFNLYGHGNFDVKSYKDYFDRKIIKHELLDAEIQASIGN